MSVRPGELSRRIRGELADLDRAVLRILQAWEGATKARGNRGVYLDSVALNLHGFYSGVERVLELVEKHVSGRVPSGKHWHEELLQASSVEVGAVRPAVIAPDSAARLDEYRRFRHLVRNVYATNLVPERLAPLVDGLPVLWAILKAELSAFADFLDDRRSTL